MPYLQHDAHSCGIHALRFLLHLVGLTQIESQVTAASLCTRPITNSDKLTGGTSERSIKKFLRAHHTRFREITSGTIREQDFPCLIGYEWSRDAHFGVVVSVSDNKIGVFNPYLGLVTMYNRQEFNRRFYSGRGLSSEDHVPWALVILH